MKFESKIKIFIVLLISANLFYLKIASDLRTNLKTQFEKSEDNSSILSKTTKFSHEIPNIHVCDSQESSSAMMSSLESSNSKLNNTNESEVVSGLGKSINDGLHPIPLPNNGLLNIRDEIISLNSSTNSTHNSSYKMNHFQSTTQQNKVNENKIKGHSHLITFMSILVILTFLTLMIINYKICQDKKRDQIFTNDAGYYLIRD